MFKNIIFDFDGTLVDSKEVVFLTYRRLVKKYNVPELKQSEIEELRTLPLKDRFKKMHFPLYKIPEVSREIQNAYKDNMNLLHSFSGIQETLYALKDKGCNLYVLSSNTKKNITMFLETNNLDIFRDIYSSPGLFGKNVTIKKVLRKHKLLKEESLYVGDELRDITACHSVGIKVAAVTWGYDSTSLLSQGNPDYLINKPEELLVVVDGTKG